MSRRSFRGHHNNYDENWRNSTNRRDYNSDPHQHHPYATETPTKPQKPLEKLPTNPPYKSATAFTNINNNDDKKEPKLDSQANKYETQYVLQAAQQTALNNKKAATTYQKSFVPPKQPITQTQHTTVPQPNISQNSGNFQHFPQSSTNFQNATNYQHYPEISNIYNNFPLPPQNYYLNPLQNPYRHPSQTYLGPLQNANPYFNPYSVHNNHQNTTNQSQTEPAPDKTTNNLFTALSNTLLQMAENQRLIIERVYPKSKGDRAKRTEHKSSASRASQQRKPCSNYNNELDDIESKHDMIQKPESKTSASKPHQHRRAHNNYNNDYDDYQHYYNEYDDYQHYNNECDDYPHYNNDSSDYQHYYNECDDYQHPQPDRAKITEQKSSTSKASQQRKACNNYNKERDATESKSDTIQRLNDQLNGNDRSHPSDDGKNEEIQNRPTARVPSPPSPITVPTISLDSQSICTPPKPTKVLTKSTTKSPTTYRALSQKPTKIIMKTAQKSSAKTPKRDRARRTEQKSSAAKASQPRRACNNYNNENDDIEPKPNENDDIEPKPDIIQKSEPKSSASRPHQHHSALNNYNNDTNDYQHYYNECDDHQHPQPDRTKITEQKSSTSKASQQRKACNNYNKEHDDTESKTDANQRLNDQLNENGRSHPSDDDIIEEMENRPPAHVPSPIIIPTLSVHAQPISTPPKPTKLLTKTASKSPRKPTKIATKTALKSTAKSPTLRPKKPPMKNPNNSFTQLMNQLQKSHAMSPADSPKQTSKKPTQSITRDL